MKPKTTRCIFNKWHQFAPKMAQHWLNRKLATVSVAETLRRDAQAADELELQCEAAGLPILRRMQQQ